MEKFCFDRKFCCLCDDAFNPLFKLVELALKKSFETAVYILQFSAYTLLATRRNLGRKRVCARLPSAFCELLMPGEAEVFHREVFGRPPGETP